VTLFVKLKLCWDGIAASVDEMLCFIEDKNQGRRHCCVPRGAGFNE
jgi:hypothetical protein